MTRVRQTACRWLALRPGSHVERWIVVSILLLAWGVRLCCLETVPPGWRDDELINIHALSGQLLAGRFPLYYLGASGHEPLYHHLHAGVHAVLGFNVLSGRLLSVILGTLSVALTFALARRLFGRRAGTLAAALLAVSFWSLMYSRTAIRHVILPPLALAAFYAYWRFLLPRSPACALSPSGRFKLGPALLLGLLLGATLYTYPAARLLPVLLILFAAYLAVFHRRVFRQQWREVCLALLVAVLVSTPMWIAIAHGRSEAAASGIGADARLDELAVPIRELRNGNPQPLLENVWGTLSMFHATGDPEPLYNVPGRPVFNLLGGLLLWAGVVLCMVRWRQPRFLFLLLWLGMGLVPAFVSVPVASLSHTILAQPVAFVLPVLVLDEMDRRLQIRSRQSPVGGIEGRPRGNSLGRGLLLVVGGAFLLTTAVRDLGDYFFSWPADGWVRFLYRGDYREMSEVLDTHHQLTDVCVGSLLQGPWDRVALDVDVRREDVHIRLFDPEQAWVWTREDGPTTVLLPAWPNPIPPAPLEPFLDEGACRPISSRVTRCDLAPPQDVPTSLLAGLPARFANGLALTQVHWAGPPPVPGQTSVLIATWFVTDSLNLPPMDLVANPPPPGVYSGPRLAIFAHLLGPEGEVWAGDDGLGVDPLTLRPGDRFVQVHRFALPAGGPEGAYAVELGLYDPMDGTRWPVLGADGDSSGVDRVLLPVPE